MGLQKRGGACNARLLPAEPRVLILDEPMARHEPGGKRSTSRVFILDAREERDVTILIIEHHMGRGHRDLRSNRRAEFTARSSLKGARHEAIADPAVVAAYLGQASRGRAIWSELRHEHTGQGCRSSFSSWPVSPDGHPSTLVAGGSPRNAAGKRLEDLPFANASSASGKNATGAAVPLGKS